MDYLIALGVIYVVGYLIYRNGKREGSKKGYGCKRQLNTVALGRSRGSAEGQRGALALTRGGLWSNDGISHQEGHEHCEGKSVHGYGDVDGSPPPRAEQGTQQASGL